MTNDQEGGSSWADCLDCPFINLRIELCPLKGKDSVDRIVNRITMTEAPLCYRFREKEKGKEQ